jgi:hypothetical protein
MTLRLGSSNTFFLGIASNGGYGPSDLQDGETALYCIDDTAVVKLDKNGNILVQAGSSTFKITKSGIAEFSPDVVFDGQIKYKHEVSYGDTPICNVGTVVGNDAAGQITIPVGGASLVTATVTFANTYPSTPVPILFPASSSAAAPTNQTFVTSANTATWQFQFNAAAGGSYVWNYLVRGTN